MTSGRSVLLLTATVVAACTAAGGGGSKQEFLFRVMDVASPEYSGEPGDPLEEACHAWTLSKAEVEAFFSLADVYEDRPYGHFYQVGCSISGQLQVDGHVQRFAINGGGIAIWEGEAGLRYLGCSDTRCAPLLLLPPTAWTPTDCNTWTLAGAPVQQRIRSGSSTGCRVGDGCMAAACRDWVRASALASAR